MAAVSLRSRSPSSQRSAAQRGDDGEHDTTPSSPQALRVRRSRWRDPRLWFGVLLVLAAVVVGAKVLAAADNTVPVWALDHPASAGMAITQADVRAIRVHFSGSGNENLYWLADQALPSPAYLTRDVGTGELLARSALTTDQTVVPHELPLAVAAAGAPAGLAPGDHVEVWAVPPAQDVRGHAQLVLSDTAVLSVGTAAVTGVAADRQFVVALPDGADTSSLLDKLNGSTVVLVRIGG